MTEGVFWSSLQLAYEDHIVTALDGRSKSGGVCPFCGSHVTGLDGVQVVVPDTTPPTQVDSAGMVEVFPKWAKAVVDSPGVVQVGLGDGTAKGFALDRVVIRGSRVFIEQ